MAAPVRLLPFLDPAPYQSPYVDPKTGMLTDAWMRYHINLERVIFGVWQDIPFDAANFSTVNPVITWNVIVGNVLQESYFQMGQLAIATFAINGGTVSANVAQLQITIPTLTLAAPGALPYINACVVIDGAAAPEPGLMLVFGGPTTQAIIGIQKASGFPFLAASALIQVYGSLSFMCNSYVAP